jgi:hypothetical protein
MDIKIKDTALAGQKLVEFTLPGHGPAYSFQMPTELAVILQAQTRVSDFKYGLEMNGQLVSVFEKAEDRDYCRDILEDIWPSGKWEEVTL